MDLNTANVALPLFVPADRPERFAKASRSGADCVIIDLEDAVAPAFKQDARAAVTLGFTSIPVWVRVNAIDTIWHNEDVSAAVNAGCDAIMLPKAEGPQQVEMVAAAAPVVALIESAQGVASAREIAKVGGVVRLAFGSIDYAADLGVKHIRETLAHARAELVLASRLAGLPAPLDGVTTSFVDLERVVDDARYARDMGFGGKLLIHPNQVAAARNGLAPDEIEIAWATRVLENDQGVSTIDGSMVDEPVRVRARQILLRASVLARGNNLSAQ